MKALKWIALLFGIYVGIVVAFESLLGYFQPSNERTLTITTTDATGKQNDRVLSLLESGGQLYVAVNHWPRAWYRQALAQPEVQATINGKQGEFVAVPVIDAEHEKVITEHKTGLGFRLLTGFPPRYFLRLDPRS